MLNKEMKPKKNAKNHLAKVKQIIDKGNGALKHAKNGINPFKQNNGSNVSKLKQQNTDNEIKSQKKVWQKPLKRKLDANPKHCLVKRPKEMTKVVPPTVEEINELKETRNLYHSNIFRLQVQEMLTELKIKEKYTSFVNSWLIKFNQFLKNIEPYAEKAAAHKMAFLTKSAVRFPLNLKKLGAQTQNPLQFQFNKPRNDAYLIGAAATQTLLGPQLTIDVCIQMPKICFQKDDYLNMAYDQKRALYLTYIAAQMLESQFEDLTVEQLTFSCFRNEPLKIVLEIMPTMNKGNTSKKLSIRIFVAVDEDSFKLSRFVPWNNNIRPNMFGGDEDSIHFATPAYNATVLYDLTMQRNQQMLQELFNGHKNFQEGLVLLKVWIKQRQLNLGYSGFSTHVLAMFIAYLFRHRKLHLNMSCYQVARTVWNQLAHSTWDENDKSITLCEVKQELQQSRPTLEQFHTYYDVVFVDVTGFLNICSNLSLEVYRRVRLEAKLAMEMLNDMKMNSFQVLFMTSCPLYTLFDHMLKINKKDAIEQLLELYVSPAEKCNYACYPYPQLLKVVTSLLRKGLGERIHALLPIEQQRPSWKANEESKEYDTYLHLGVILNVEKAFEVLDKGPESIAADAEDFRKFWGDKAELRRFQDGSITESVVWASASDSLSKKRTIVGKIVLHLLQHHFQLSPSDVEYIGSDFDIVYKLTSAYKIESVSQKYSIKQDTDAEELSLQVIRAFDDLTRKLHALNELPLEIVSISGISAVFRYSDPNPLLPLARSINGQFHATHVQHGVMQLGVSGKWPSELAALRSLKTAFYIQIARLLREKCRLQVKVSYEGIFVLSRGYCFIIEIAHPKEVALLKKQTIERGITQYVDCKASIDLEKRNYILPKVTGALHALYHQQSSFGGTVMVAKRWLYSQLIDDGLWPDECTELLVASLFFNAYAQQSSCSTQTYFIRFLQFLSNTDWRTELVLINFNNELDENEVFDLEQRFNTMRENFPPLCIATAYDQKHYGVIWTSTERPNVNVLARVTILARQTLAIIEKTLLSPVETFIRPGQIFTTSNKGYDLVIQLKPDIVPNTLAYEFGSPFVPLEKPNWKLPLAGTNYLREAVAKLREAYNEFAIFFYNPCGGKEIALIWKPNIFVEKDFKVTDVNGCTLSSTNKTKIQCKRENFIEDFKIILKDFYLRIDTVQALGELKKNKQLITKAKSTETHIIVDSKNLQATKVSVPKEKIIKNPNKIKKVVAKQQSKVKKNASKILSKNTQKNLSKTQILRY